VVVTDDIGCTGSSDTLRIEVDKTGIEEMFGFGMSIYPNPTSDQLFIELEEANSGFLTISVSDLSGRIIRSFPDKFIQAETKIALDLNGLASGTYLLNLSKDGKSISHKISKN
jgi:hypothetical protein